MSKGPEQRRHPRIKIQLEIELLLPDDQSLMLQSGNMSQEGLFVRLDQELHPAVGSEVYVRLKNALGDGEPPLVKARVVRAEESGIGLHFEEDDGDPAET